jgi:predicted porin
MLALGGLTVSASAADLDSGSLKDPLPDTLTYKGVTVYGAIDVGYAYQTHGVPVGGANGAVLNTTMFGSANSNRAISTMSANGLSQSFIGVKAEEAIGMGWTVLAKAETGFQPLSGELIDQCATLNRNAGKDLFHQDANGDGGRCGQFFNGPLYAGVSNSAYGTLTVGRQNSLDLELLAAYDPMSLSYAFSLIGFSGSVGAGIGATADSRWDNSLKYVYQYGPMHASFMYAQGGQDTAMHGPGIAAGVGGTWRGVSVDVLYSKETNAIKAGIPAVGFIGTKSVTGTGVDEEAWTVGAKYTFDLGGYGGWKDGGCGLKDDCAGAKLTFFGGYQRSSSTDPSDNLNVGDTTQGGYVLVSVDNNAFTTAKIWQTSWAGAKYETGPWSFTGAYYRLDQNSYIADNKTCAQKTAAVTVGQKVGSNCSGTLNMGSFLIDYAFNKHFDVYAGVNYSAVDGGLSSGFLQTDEATFMTGMRLRF